MANEVWTTLPFTEAVLVNPSIRLTKGAAYPFVEMAAVDPNTRSVHESEIREFKGSGARFMPGDTLMARITPCLENGKIARFQPTNGTSAGFGSTEFIVIRGRDGITDNDFAYYLTKWSEFRQFAISQMTGSSGRQHVPVSSLTHFEVTIPPISVQRRIAHILGTLDDKIELNRKMNQKLEAIARAIFKSWFVDFDPVIDNALVAGKPIPEEFAERAARRAQLPHEGSSLPENIRRLFPDEFQDSELGPIPKGWEVGQLGDLVGFLSGYAFRSRDWRDKGIPVVKIGSIKPGIIDLDTVSYVSEQVATQASRYRLSPADLLVGMTGYVGEVGLVPPTDNLPLLNQRVGKFVPEKNGTESLGFVYCLTRRPQFKAEVEAKSHGTAQANVSAKGILSIVVILPPRPLRGLFNQICKPIFDQILNNWAKSRTLATLRDALLPNLIRGEIRVKDAKRFLREKGIC